MDNLKIQTNLKNKLCGVLCLSALLFSSYSLFRVGSFFVTAFILLAPLVIGLSVINGKGLFSKKDVWAYVLLSYILMNFLFQGASNPTAFLLISFYVGTYLCSFRYVGKKDFNKQIAVFQKIMNVLAVYGIYQLFGRMGHLPLTDLKVPGFMVEGFNWTNLSSVGGIHVFRSNAIFLEPSVFSQILAINILLYLDRVLFSKIPFKELKSEICLIGLNFIAMLTTLSGTGYIILFFSLCFLLPVKGMRKSSVYKCLKIILIVSLVIFFFAPYLKLDVFDYLMNRFSEIFEYKDNNASGYLRFTGAFLVMLESFKENLLFGCGLGELKYFTQTLSHASVELNGYVANGIVRVGTELGVIGLTGWFLFLFSIVRRWVKMNHVGVIFVISACAMNLTSEAFSSTYFWMMLCFTNVSIVEDC